MVPTLRHGHNENLPNKVCHCNIAAETLANLACALRRTRNEWNFSDFYLCGIHPYTHIFGPGKRFFGKLPYCFVPYQISLEPRKILWSSYFYRCFIMIPNLSAAFITILSTFSWKLESTLASPPPTAGYHRSIKVSIVVSLREPNWTPFFSGTTSSKPLIGSAIQISPELFRPLNRSIGGTEKSREVPTGGRRCEECLWRLEMTRQRGSWAIYRFASSSSGDKTSEQRVWRDNTRGRGGWGAQDPVPGQWQKSAAIRRDLVELPAGSPTPLCTRTQPETKPMMKEEKIRLCRGQCLCIQRGISFIKARSGSCTYECLELACGGCSLCAVVLGYSELVIVTLRFGGWRQYEGLE